MQLKSAATFLMIGSIVLIVYKLIWLFYMFILGVFFFGGMLSANVQGLVAILAGVVSLIVAVSFRKGGGQSAKRITTAIFLAIVSGLWIGAGMLSMYDYLEWLPLLGNDGMMALCSHIVFLLSCVALMLMGVALAGNNGLRLRRACIWVIVCCGLSVLISLGISVHTLVTNRADGMPEMVFMALEIVSLLFPLAWVLLSFALLRNPEILLPGARQEEF